MGELAVAESDGEGDGEEDGEEDGEGDDDDVPALVDVHGAELTGAATPPSPSPRISSAAADTPAPAIAATSNAATSTPRGERRDGDCCSAVAEGAGAGDAAGVVNCPFGTSRWVGV